VHSRPPAIGRSAINEFRKARAQFRRERAAADAAREARLATASSEAVAEDEVTAPPGESATFEPLVLLSHGEPLSLALSRRRRDESASFDRRLRLSRLVAREDRLNEAIAELAAADTIDLRDAEVASEVESETLAPVVDLRERAEARAEATDQPS
jgi:hypothetical protein